MLSALRLEGVAYRFEPFVDELRSFLRESNVAYGFPEHLLAFAARVSSPTTLRAGVSAKLLAVIRGSQQPVSHGELVELLLVTVGGANIDEDTPAVQKAERVLSRLVGEVMTSRDGVLSWEHLTAEAPVEQDAATPACAPAFMTADPEIAPATKIAAREVIAWASPPTFVWAALLCGVLLPPCMYFLSRPNRVQAVAPRTASSSTLHSAVQRGPAPPLELPKMDEMPSLDLLPDNPPAPKKRRPPAQNPPGVVQTIAPSTFKDAPPASASDPKAFSGADKTSRETDMPGRDLGTPEPVLVTPQIR